MPTDAVDYENRYTALNDALWLIQRGPRVPHLVKRDERAERREATTGVDPLTWAYSSAPVSEGDPRYVEVSLALDLAYFLLNGELPESDDDDD